MTTPLLNRVKQIGYKNPKQLWNLVCLLYPITYVILVPVSLYSTKYSKQISEIWFVKFLENYIVRNYMILWFSILYFINLLQFHNLQISISLKDQSTIKNFKIYVINVIWLIILLEWFFGSPIFERISIALGAFCSKTEFYTEYKCLKENGKWINLFDSSSHYTMLISNSLLIWNLIIPFISTKLLKYKSNDLEEAAGFQQEINDNDDSYNIKKYIVYLSILFIVLWYISFVITSLFFHTILEKLVGLVCGMTIPLLIQFI
ncbi:uncharacterized protein KGF55_003276 [Candida pseudojiufengensis]|uniref:uncharacterized protein n=1 Tax=Candida pseudojiufengensis TaxID=497109 RepID=UPI0022248E55|nr:uncharacterized protein KGF55_003276 [Candida pseudojiufengensis]KAI5962200.1 hypothetical protein KGF55_003276 [Candida pseudojiufengensis]